MAWFPTVEWLELYREAINEDDEYAEHAAEWGDGWNGDFVFEIRGLPLDEHTVSDLPDELLELRKVPDEVWSEVDDGARDTLIDEYGEAPVYALTDEVPDAIVESLPDDVRGLLEDAEGFFDEDPALEDASDEMPAALEDALPPQLDRLMTELDEKVDEDTVYAHIGLERGDCTEVGMVESREESDAAFVIHGEYDDWKELIEGSDPIQLIMSGKLELEGDMNRVMEYAEAAQRLAGVSAETETRYIF